MYLGETVPTEIGYKYLQPIIATGRKNYFPFYTKFHEDYTPLISWNIPGKLNT